MEYKLSKEEHRNRLEQVRALEPLLKLPEYRIQDFNIGRDATGSKLVAEDMRTVVFKCRSTVKDRDGKIGECSGTTMGAISLARAQSTPVIVAMNCDSCRCGYNIVMSPVEMDEDGWGILVDISYKYFPVRIINILLGEE